MWKISCLNNITLIIINVLSNHTWLVFLYMRYDLWFLFWWQDLLVWNHQSCVFLHFDRYMDRLLNHNSLAQNIWLFAGKTPRFVSAVHDKWSWGKHSFFSTMFPFFLQWESFLSDQVLTALWAYDGSYSIQVCVSALPPSSNKSHRRAHLMFRWYSM